MEGEKQSTAVTLSNSSNGNTQHSNITCMRQHVEPFDSFGLGL